MEFFQEDPQSRTVFVSEAAIVDGLVQMLRHRDPVTASHLDSVGLLAGRLAEALGLDATVVEHVTLAGRLHDIGKQAVALSLLNKPSALDAEEWREIRMHAHFGATIVAGFAPLAHYAEVVRSHHERVDGRGYPDGLVGDQIPFESRIIAVADAFHAMTVSRPYARVRTPHDALLELQAHAGTQFDAECVRAFCSVMGFRARALRSA